MAKILSPEETASTAHLVLRNLVSTSLALKFLVCDQGCEIFGGFLRDVCDLVAHGRLLPSDADPWEHLLKLRAEASGRILHDVDLHHQESLSALLNQWAPSVVGRVRMSSDLVNGFGCSEHIKIWEKVVERLDPFSIDVQCCNDMHNIDTVVNALVWRWSAGFRMRTSRNASLPPLSPLDAINHCIYHQLVPLTQTFHNHVEARDMLLSPRVLPFKPSTMKRLEGGYHFDLEAAEKLDKKTGGCHFAPATVLALIHLAAANGGMSGFCQKPFQWS